MFKEIADLILKWFGSEGLKKLYQAVINLAKEQGIKLK